MLSIIILLVMALILGVLVITFLEMLENGLSFSRALRLAPYKIFYGLDTTNFKPALGASAPTFYLISAQSALDNKIYAALLPSETVHLSGEQSTEALQNALKQHGRIAVYIPENVEPDDKQFAIFASVATAANVLGAVVVPLYLKGARFLASSMTPAEKAPRATFPALSVHALPPLSVAHMVTRSGASRTTPAVALFDRMAVNRFQSADFNVGLFEALVGAAKTYGPNRIILEDTVTGSLTYKRVLVGARVLGKKFQKVSQPREAMGVLLPNANGAIVTFFALQSANRVAAMLNYTAGPKNVVSAITAAAIKTVITSRAFIEKAELQNVVDAIVENGTQIMWLEDVRAGVSAFDKISALLQWQKPLEEIDAESAAVILFTSGSEGTPKGVVLSHRNIHANAAQSEARVSISVEDTLFNVLPVFHSFGLTGGTILPLFYGVRLFLYPSPLHYKLILRLRAKSNRPLCLGLILFSNGLARTAKDQDFSSLRFVVAGAEAVKPETAQIYRERFDCLILEGFGMTEAAPVVAVNTKTHSKARSVGRLLPGIDIRLEPVEGIDAGGRMWVSGPNVMLGYMKAENPGVLEPIGDAWHDSGDIVDVDGNGFVTIKGRVKRFAKIAGEMVSLGAVEMLVQSLWPEDQHAVVSVPDKRKGERIILATTGQNTQKSALIEHGKKSGVTELMVPSDILRFDDGIPVLGSGKIDYVSTKKRVEEVLGIGADEKL
ncbi:MAG: AMP-binding protein [Ahrensia sp.]|nr:AMP-binding protein [Ahrensia sp.]